MARPKSTKKGTAKKAGKVTTAKQKARKVSVKRRIAPSEPEKVSLLRPLVALRRQLDDLLEDFTSYWPQLRVPLVEWPSLHAVDKSAGIVRFDISEGVDSVTVTAEVPGMEEKDVEVVVEGGSLTIRGEKKSEREEKGDDFYISERQFGSFSRSIRLPHGIDVENISANFDKGVLTVTLPKIAAAKEEPRHIEVEP